MAGPTRFTKRQRLLSRADFERVQNGSRTRRGSSPHFLVLLATPELPGSGPRLGVIASRRVGSAVHRNRAKRLIREFFRSNTGAIGDYDMVVVVHPGADTLTAAQAAAEIAAALSRAAGAAPSARPPRAKPVKRKKA